MRRYKTGPVAEARVTAEMREREGGGTHLVYQVWATPRGALGRAVIPVQVGRVSRRRFAQVIRRYDAQAARVGEQQQNGSAPGARLASKERALLDSQRRKLLDEGGDARLVSRLVETIEAGDELTLARLRPYALADSWGVARRDALELCLDMNGKPAPTEFRTSTGSGRAYEKLTRVSMSRPENVTGGTPLAQQPPSPKHDGAGFEYKESATQTRLQGEWTPVKIVRDGQEIKR